MPIDSSPSKTVKGQISWIAYFIYNGILLTIYFILSATKVISFYPILPFIIVTIVSVLLWLRHKKQNS